MKEISVYNKKGQKVDTVELNEKIFSQKVNTAVLHQAITMYLSNQRKGAASTKTRARVKGGGQKPWKQKGTGRARAGSIRSPIFRGGGVIFGPNPRDYSYSLPKKITKKALLSSINSKIQNNNIVVVDKLEIDKPKTKEFASVIKALKLKDNKVLFIVDNSNENLKKASRNMKSVLVRNVNNVNAHDVLASDKLMVTRKSLDIINKRVSL